MNPRLLLEQIFDILDRFRAIGRVVTKVGEGNLGEYSDNMRAAVSGTHATDAAAIKNAAESLKTLLPHRSTTNGTVWEHLQQLFERTYANNNLRVEVAAVSHIENLDRWFLHLDVKNGSKRVGRVESSIDIYPDNQFVAELMTFELNKRERGQGFGTDFSNNLEDVYSKIGVQRIKIYAGDKISAGDVDGPWFAYEQGYKFDRNFERQNCRALKEGVEVVLARSNLKGADKEALTKLHNLLAKGHLPTVDEIATWGGQGSSLGKTVLLATDGWDGIKDL